MFRRADELLPSFLPSTTTSLLPPSAPPFLSESNSNSMSHSIEDWRKANAHPKQVRTVSLISLSPSLALAFLSSVPERPKMDADAPPSTSLHPLDQLPLPSLLSKLNILPQPERLPTPDDSALDTRSESSVDVSLSFFSSLLFFRYFFLSLLLGRRLDVVSLRMQAWKESKGGKGEEGGPVKGGREGGAGRKLIHLPSTQVLFLQLLKLIHPSSSLLLLPGFLAV